MRKRIAILSTESAHHTYFINSLEKEGFLISLILFETQRDTPPFETEPFYKELQEEYENEHFFKNVPDKLISSLNTEYVPNVNDEKISLLLKKNCIDIGVVFGCGKIKPFIFKGITDGFINVHRGIAEQYRGLDSDLWAIYHKDYNNIGVTIHAVDRELDCGDILSCNSLRLFRNMKVYQLRYFTSVLATDLVCHALSEYEKGHIYRRKQFSTARYYSYMPLCLKKIVGKRFEEHCAKLED